MKLDNEMKLLEYEARFKTLSSLQTKNARPLNKDMSFLNLNYDYATPEESGDVAEK